MNFWKCLKNGIFLTFQRGLWGRGYTTRAENSYRDSTFQVSQHTKIWGHSKTCPHKKCRKVMELLIYMGSSLSDQMVERTPHKSNGKWLLVKISEILICRSSLENKQELRLKNAEMTSGKSCKVKQTTDSELETSKTCARTFPDFLEELCPFDLHMTFKWPLGWVVRSSKLQIRTQRPRKHEHGLFQIMWRNYVHLTFKRPPNHLLQEL